MATQDSFYRKTNLSYAGSEKESPNKRGNSPSLPNSTAGNSKKGFFNIFSGKKKADETFSPTKPGMEMANTTMKTNNVPTNKGKSRMVNKKNIADGKIRLNIHDNDRVPEDYQIEYRDDPFEILDHNPSRTTSYIENLRTRDFTLINNREVKRFVESQQQKKDIAPPLAVQNLELDLLDLQVSYERFFGKFYRFFQGLLPGFCALHIFLIFGSSDTQIILDSYAINCLRLYQIIYLIAIISALGAAHRYTETRTRYLESVHSQPLIKDSLNLQRKKYLIATIFYGLTYLITVFNREFIGILSNSYGSIDADALSKRFQVFQILSAITTGLSLAGWLTLVLAFEEISNIHMDMAHHHDLTNDETIDEEL